jgi:hypothetical protein
VCWWRPCGMADGQEIERRRVVTTTRCRRAAQRPRQIGRNKLKLEEPYVCGLLVSDLTYSRMVSAHVIQQTCVRFESDDGKLAPKVDELLSNWMNRYSWPRVDVMRPPAIQGPFWGCQRCCGDNDTVEG